MGTLASSITNALFSLYQAGFVDKVAEVMQAVVNAVQNVVNMEPFNSAFSIFAGIAASLIVLYFYFDLLDQISREMMSFEKFVVMFIKMIVCVAVVACSQQICNLIMDLAGDAFSWMKELADSYLNEDTYVVFTANGENTRGNSVTLEGEITEEQFAELFAERWGSGLTNWMANLKLMVTHPFWSMNAIIVSLVTAIIKLIAYFLCISTGVTLLTRFFFAPIGIVNLYRGEQSSGMQYFKSLLATACTFAAQIIIIMVATRIGQAVIFGDTFSLFGLTFGDGSSYLNEAGQLVIDVYDKESISNALNFGTVIIALVPQLAAIGGMGAAGRIMNDVFGARG